MKTIIVKTRENRKGEWWCSTTLKGMDISVTRKTVDEARERIKKEIEKIDISVSISWEDAQNYVHDVETEKPQIGYAANRIDKGMV